MCCLEQVVLSRIRYSPPMQRPQLKFTFTFMMLPYTSSPDQEEKSDLFVPYIQIPNDMRCKKVCAESKLWDDAEVVCCVVDAEIVG